MRKIFLWGEVWIVVFENVGSVDHCGKNWGEAASRGGRSTILGTPPLRMFMASSLIRKQIDLKTFNNNLPLKKITHHKFSIFLLLKMANKLLILSKV